MDDLFIENMDDHLEVYATKEHFEALKVNDIKGVQSVDDCETDEDEKLFFVWVSPGHAMEVVDTLQLRHREAIG